MGFDYAVNQRDNLRMMGLLPSLWRRIQWRLNKNSTKQNETKKKKMVVVPSLHCLPLDFFFRKRGGIRLVADSAAGNFATATLLIPIDKEIIVSVFIDPSHALRIIDDG